MVFVRKIDCRSAFTVVGRCVLNIDIIVLGIQPRIAHQIRDKRGQQEIGGKYQACIYSNFVQTRCHMSYKPPENDK